jgi:hypothetical protein
MIEMRIESKCRQKCLNGLKQPDFLNRVIPGDESWFFEYDPETKRQSKEWHTPQSPRQKKARISKSKLNTMVVIFFDSRGVVHKEFVPPGVTVNQKYFLEVQDRLRKRVRMVIAGDWILHGDNAPAHTALSVRW